MAAAGRRFGAWMGQRRGVHRARKAWDDVADGQVAVIVVLALDNHPWRFARAGAAQDVFSVATGYRRIACNAASPARALASG